MQNSLLILLLLPLSVIANTTRVPIQNSTIISPQKNITTVQDMFRLMFEAQDRFRTDNYMKPPRDFLVDWDWDCHERYKWPRCCFWSEKKRFARGTSDCTHIKGDVILDNDHDANIFQAFADIAMIQGSLVVRNTSLSAFGMPFLTSIGFIGPNPNRVPATIIFQDNPLLIKLRLRVLNKLVKNETQRYGLFVNNPRLRLDAKQWQILYEAANDTTDFKQFEPPSNRYVRHLFSELYPYFLFGALVIGVFTHHFIMLEVNEYRVKFDKDVLHLCTDQVELMEKIQKVLDADVQAFKEPELEEVTPRGLSPTKQ